MLAMTSDFHGESRNSTEIRAALARIAQAGFSHVHWCHEWTGAYLYSVYEMLQIKEWCDNFELMVKGVHATSGDKNSDLKNYLSSNIYSRLAGVELIKNRVDLAYILNAGAIVLHFSPPWQQIENEVECKDFLIQRAFKSFDELEPYCKTRNIKLCVETGGPPELYCKIYDILFERYDRTFLGLCLDTGHDLIHCKENCLEYAGRYNDRLFMVHTDDNHGETDEHLIPFDGGFDWEGFAPLLAKSPYIFPILMEPSMKTYEGEDESEWLKKAFGAGNRFSAMVEKYRS